MRTMGYDSYTDRFLKNKALTSGAEVLDMCEDLLSSVQEKSAAEHCQLLSLKQQVVTVVVLQDSVLLCVVIVTK